VSKSSQKTTPFERRQASTGRRVRVRKVESQEKTTGKTVPLPNKISATKPMKATSQEPTSRVKKVANSSVPPTKSGATESNNEKVIRPQPTAVEAASRVRPQVTAATKRRETTVIKEARVKDVNRQIPTFKPNVTPINTVQTRKKKLQNVQKPQKSQRRKTSIRKASPTPMGRALLYALRLLIIGVGIGAIMGTMLSILDPATRLNSRGVSSNAIASETDSQKTSSEAKTYGLTLSSEITTLKSKVENLVSEYPSMTPGVLFVDIENIFPRCRCRKNPSG
jgi:beta-lactamase class A